MSCVFACSRSPYSPSRSPVRRSALLLPMSNPLTMSRTVGRMRNVSLSTSAATAQSMMFPVGAPSLVSAEHMDIILDIVMLYLPQI